MRERTSDLILLRHGESEWNRLNLFTGWYDCDLTDTGRDEAAAAGTALADAGVEPTVLHTSLQKRAIRTAQLALDAMDRLWLPVRRSWRLNERHYGDLTGKNKAETAAEFGEDQVKVWRRSYDVPPPPISDGEPVEPERRRPVPDAATRPAPDDRVPRRRGGAGCSPTGSTRSSPDLRAGETVLVVAHGNSLRALVKHLDGISDDEITELNIPTGVPLHYEIGARLPPGRGEADVRALPRRCRRHRGEGRGGRGAGAPRRSADLRTPRPSRRSPLS